MATLSVDGWTSPDGVGVVGMALEDCLVVCRCDDDRHTAGYLDKVISEEVKGMERELGVQVVAIVTDNAANMVAARNRQQDAFTYHCQCHLIHLICGDLFKDAKRAGVLAQVVSVLKTFRNTQLLATALRNVPKNRPPLPCDTRCEHFFFKYVYILLNQDGAAYKRLCCTTTGSGPLSHN